MTVLDEILGDSTWGGLVHEECEFPGREHLMSALTYIEDKLSNSANPDVSYRLTLYPKWRSWDLNRYILLVEVESL